MNALDHFGPATRAWFEESFADPTRIQTDGWPPIAAGGNALLLAPTGSGKTLAAFLSCIDQLTRAPDAIEGLSVIYISPLKALVYDIERNLRAPLAGVRRTADRLGHAIRVPAVDVRTGDTPQDERRAQLKNPGDILVTTPESLYLLLTSQARKNLRSVRTVIVDEIHVMAGTKRGVHLALSLERLSALADVDPQRIGLSATQRPLDAIARFLGGDREVAIVDASEQPRLRIQIAVPIDDMENPPRPAVPIDPSGSLMLGAPGESAHPQPNQHGIWPSVYPKILEAIRAHRSTIVFTNSRLLCERMAQKLNEMAGEELVLAHHGSISHKRRSEIEEKLKSGALPALVATSSLELGIDMGAVDQVILIESPGSSARGLQRIGRAGHGVGQISEGQIFPKYRGDLLECAVVAQHMLRGEIEATRVPKNCVDVLAQQIVAMIAMDDYKVDDLDAIVRRASPYAELSRDVLTGVLDMLSGRYPSDEFAELTPRINWDRTEDLLTARRSARTLSIMNAGTIPDRGLYRVQMVPDGPRLGELDEEMVYETRQGDFIILGASTWRVEGVERDRVLVSPAPGHPGRLPFWRGERPGRPIELGRAIGKFLADYDRIDEPDKDGWLAEHTVLDAKARKNLAAYVAEQKDLIGSLPTDKAITVERFRDEIGDWRICILTPFGTRVHAPWALALEAQLSLRAGFEVDVMYSDDGIALRLADAPELPDVSALFPDPELLEEKVVEQLSHSAMFAARFRENAGRALLLPKRNIRGRTPLWLQRRRSQALMSVAQRFPAFPIVLETYRECLQDVFDLPSLVEILTQVRSRAIRVNEAETRTASPFARTLVFQYVAAYLYDGDAPLAERKAHALTLDRNLLRELLGQEELRELLDATAIADVEAELQWLDGERYIRHADAVHDLLRRLGDLTGEEIAARADNNEGAPSADNKETATTPMAWVNELLNQRRAVRVRIGNEARFIAVEDAARYRDALGVALPAGLPGVFLEATDRPLEALIARFARTHGPFHPEDIGNRWGVDVAQIVDVLRSLEARDLMMQGDLRPGGVRREWCDPEVLRRLKRRSLARLRNEIAPVDADVLARFLLQWHDVFPHRRGKYIEDIIDQLEGLPLPFSTLESEILPARIPKFSSRMLDELGASGAIVWIGHGALGTKDGKVALYRRERVALLFPREHDEPEDAHSQAILHHLRERGASFFVELQPIVQLPAKELLDVLWDLVWSGHVTNDTFAPLRGLSARSSKKRDAFSRMVGGRWGAVSNLVAATPTPTEQLHARVNVLLERYGLISREAAVAAEIPGGYTAIYPVLRAMEEAGKVRRGLFVDGLGGAQFGLSGAVDRLRDSKKREDRVVVLAATDPANAWGTLLPWPKTGAQNDDHLRPSAGARPRRVPGAQVVLLNGEPILFVEKGARSMLTFVDPTEGADAIKQAVDAFRKHNLGKAFWIKRVDGVDADKSGAAPALLDAGFERDYRGLNLTR